MPVDKEEKTVDIDTSGPGADVEIPEEKIIPVEKKQTIRGRGFYNRSTWKSET